MSAAALPATPPAPGIRAGTTNNLTTGRSSSVLSTEDNALVTNTDPGTAMGEVFRRFWLPVALSEELPGPDCAPTKVQILGEKLIAFRDTSGRVGLVDAFCPHHGAPLFFGRNEEDGLRCVYHGWKFNVEGICVDLPSAQEGATFKNKIHIKSYPCQEVAGMVFAYMGPADKQPPFPEFEWAKLPATHTYVSKFRLECNYLQAMEGDYDPAHGNFLHTTLQDVRIPNPLYKNGQRNQIALPPLNAPIPADEPFPFAIGTRRVTAALQEGYGGLEDTVAGESGIWAESLRMAASRRVSWQPG